MDKIENMDKIETMDKIGQYVKIEQYGQNGLNWTVQTKIDEMTERKKGDMQKRDTMLALKKSQFLWVFKFFSYF